MNETKVRLSDHVRSRLHGRQSELSVLQRILTDARASSEGKSLRDGTQEEQETTTNPLPEGSPQFPHCVNLEESQVSSHEKCKSQHFVFVRGKSGTGKSTLVEAAIQQSSTKDCDSFPTFLVGKAKFEQGQTDATPFGTLRSCISDVCETLAAFRNSKEGFLYVNRLKHALDNDSLDLLNGFAPNLYDFLGQDEHMPKPQTASLKSLETLKHALRTFLVAIAHPERPLVLCLDDLQWIDVPSLKLLQVMLKNSALKHLVFIGIYRDDEVGSEHLLRKWMDSMSNTPTHIEVTGISPETMISLLQDVFHAHPVGNTILDEYQKAIHDLATLLHTFTDGNAFHLLELLDYLQAETLLSYSVSTFKWTWDIEDIKDQTSLSENMVSIVMEKLKCLPVKVQETVLICSLIGFRFDMTSLDASVNGLSNIFSVTPADLNSAITSLTTDGILSQAKGRIKFAHDKIYQAACNLHTDLNTNKLHYLIGTALFSSFSEKNWSSDNRLFACVDQLNLGIDFVVESRERLELARLNLVACSHACRLSAFLRAFKHIEISIKLVDRSLHWTTNYGLLLELFTLKAELGCVLGDMMQIEDARNEIAKHAVSQVDKARMSLASIKAMFSQAHYADGLAELVQVLHGFGVVFPVTATKKMNRSRYAKLKSQINSMTRDQLLSLPVMRNEYKAAAMKMLDVSWDVLVSNNNELGDLSVLIMIELSLNHGWSSESPLCLAHFAALAAAFEDQDFAIQMQQLSSDLIKQSGTHPGRARVLIANIPILYWTTALPKLTDFALEAYSTAMQTGDIKKAMMAMLMYVSMYFYSGLPLGPVLADLEKLMSVMMDYGQDTMLLMTLPFYQCISNLMGKSKNILQLEAGLLKKHRERLSWNESGVGQESLLSLQIQMAVYCNEIKLAMELASKLKANGDNASRSLYIGQTRAFFFCLIEISLARADQRFKLKYHIARALSIKEAKHHYAIIKRFAVEKKNFNLAHKLLILDAEMMSLQKSTTVDELRCAYDKAILAAKRAGFVQDAALAAQLASHRLPEEASLLYWEQASELYAKWGAKGIVHYLENKHGHFSRSTAIEDTGTFIRGKQRYDTSVAEAHQKIDIAF